MADCIESQITQSIKNAINGKALTGFTNTITAELDRINISINDRYPFVVLSGPATDTDAKTSEVDECTLEYALRCFIDINDDSEAANTEITYITRNVNAELIKLIMADRQRGGLAQTTKTTSRGYDFELVGDEIEYYTYVTLEVSALIDTLDPKLLP